MYCLHCYWPNWDFDTIQEHCQYICQCQSNCCWTKVENWLEIEGIEEFLNRKLYGCWVAMKYDMKTQGLHIWHPALLEVLNLLVIPQLLGNRWYLLIILLSDLQPSPIVYCNVWVSQYTIYVLRLTVSGFWSSCLSVWNWFQYLGNGF